MTDVPISDALIDSAQFQIQSVEPRTTGAGLVRLFRGLAGWTEKGEDGTIRSIESELRFRLVTVSATELLALNSVPKVLVPALGGKTIVPVSVAYVLTVGANVPTGSQIPRLGYLSTVDSTFLNEWPGPSGALLNNVDTVGGWPFIAWSEDAIAAVGAPLVLGASSDATGPSDTTAVFGVTYYSI